MPLGHPDVGPKSRPSTRGPHSTADIKVIELQDDALEQVSSGFYTAGKYIFFAALFATALVLLYLVLLVPNVARGVYKEHPEQLVAVLRGQMLLLEVSLAVLGVTFVALTWEETKVGGLVAGAGILLHVGVPFLTFALGGRNAVTAALTHGFRNAGFWLVLLGGAKLCLQAFFYFRQLPHRLNLAANVGVPQRVSLPDLSLGANLFTPCWELGFCREVIRRQCPAFLAKTKCWKFGSGCYCDVDMIQRIIEGENLHAIQAPTQFARSAAMGKSRPPCQRCYIFLEHQSHKLRWVSPLALPLAVAFSFFSWPLYDATWNGTRGAFGWLWRSVAYSAFATQGPPAQNSVPGQLDADQVARIAENLGGFAVGFLMFVVILRLMEMAIERWGW